MGCSSSTGAGGSLHGGALSRHEWDLVDTVSSISPLIREAPDLLGDAGSVSPLGLALLLYHAAAKPAYTANNCAQLVSCKEEHTKCCCSSACPLD